MKNLEALETIKNIQITAPLDSYTDYDTTVGEFYDGFIEEIELALKTLNIIASFKLRTVIESDHYLLIIGSMAYEITKEQYDIVNKYLEDK